jgi:uncharacterized protein YlaN (UPF0358 family)
MNTTEMTAHCLEVPMETAEKLLKGVRWQLDKMAAVVPDCPSFDEAEPALILDFAAGAQVQAELGAKFTNRAFNRRLRTALERLHAMN